ncbi:MAG TPA: hypothetical protein VK112_06585 [Fodinibius sp.]|nr:hypothetical protein [Fodinibius sp.]
MNRERWQKMEYIIDKALRLNSLPQQDRYIRQACKDDLPLSLQTYLWMRAIRDAKDKSFME